MDAKKIKQMGRDYFAANPDKPCRQLSDKAFKASFSQWEIRVQDACLAWRAGWHEARYAASKEGRAIELLGRLTTGKDNDLNWHNATAFLREIGWKPNTNTQD